MNIETKRVKLAQVKLNPDNPRRISEKDMERLVKSLTDWEYNRANSNDFHPTQKPVELSLRAIKNSSESGQIVVDAFGGSGATMVSCENLGRACRMLELDPLYCAVILQRMTDAFPGIEIRRENA